MVTCQICGQQMNWIQNTHLKKHNMTLEEYREKFPNSPTKTQAVHEEIVRTRYRVKRVPIKICKREGCGKPVTNWRVNIYCSSRCNALDNESVGLHHKGFAEKGSLNHNYVNGDYSSNKSQKELAYERDNGRCVKCGLDVDGIKNRYGVHHIIPRRLFSCFKEADNIDNLLTLCSSCHRDEETNFANILFMLYTTENYMTITELREYVKNTIILNRETT